MDINFLHQPKIYANAAAADKSDENKISKQILHGLPSAQSKFSPYLFIILRFILRRVCLSQFYDCNDNLTLFHVIHYLQIMRHGSNANLAPKCYFPTQPSFPYNHPDVIQRQMIVLPLS